MTKVSFSKFSDIECVCHRQSAVVRMLPVSGRNFRLAPPANLIVKWRRLATTKTGRWEMREMTGNPNRSVICEGLNSKCISNREITKKPLSAIILSLSLSLSSLPFPILIRVWCTRINTSIRKIARGRPGRAFERWTFVFSSPTNVSQSTRTP